MVVFQLLNTPTVLDGSLELTQMHKTPKPPPLTHHPKDLKLFKELQASSVFFESALPFGAFITSLPYPFP